MTQIQDNISMKHVHLFGAYFGLAVSSRFSEPSPRSEKNASTPKSDLLSMLGKTFGLMPQTEEEIVVRARKRFWGTGHGTLKLLHSKYRSECCPAQNAAVVHGF